MEIKYPKGEVSWVRYMNADGDPVFILTSKQNRDYYYLYEVLSNGELNKLGKSRSPIELEERYNVKERMMCRNA